jgi:hypothetical protein
VTKSARAAVPRVSEALAIRRMRKDLCRQISEREAMLLDRADLNPVWADWLRESVEVLKEEISSLDRLPRKR